MDRRAILKYTAYATGYALTAPLTSAFLSGCAPEPAGPDFTPAFLSADTYQGMRAMVNTMLPETETAGALEVGVPEFIDLVLNTYTEVELQQHIKTGLEDWLSVVKKGEGKAYYELEPARQLGLLNELDAGAKQEEEAMATAPSSNGDEEELNPWWLELKSLAINGFFASEKIGTEVLAYDPVPGPYQGNYPLSKVGRAWSL